MAKIIIPDLVVERRAVSSLKPHPRCARIHPKLQINRIAASLKAFGVVKPLLIDGEGQVLAGNAVLQATKDIGLSEVPVVRIDHLTPSQLRAFMLADNKLAELSHWNPETLAIELESLLSLDPELDITVTGFDGSEIDLIFEQAAGHKEEDSGVEVPLPGPAISQEGDLWKLGRHRVFCGNALSELHFQALMGRARAQLVFTDPPYNVRINGHVSGTHKHREFVAASGEMDIHEFIAFLSPIFQLLIHYSVNGSIHFICMDHGHIWELLNAAFPLYGRQLNVCVWVKDNGGMGSLYRSQHEFVVVFRNGKAPHRNNVQLGKYGRNRTNVWTYPGISTLSKRSEEGNLLALHPTVKPLTLVADAILDCSARGDIVLDSFLGSGTTLIAAERVGRICYGMELDPLYVDTAIRRWQRYTGETAVHAATGETFDDRARKVEVDHD